MTDFLLKLTSVVNNYLSNYVLLILLISIGVFYSFKTRFVQVRCFGEGIKSVFSSFSLRGKKQTGGLSSFQALATSIGAQVGTGNIIGACNAILIGGPGAIFWMWVIAFFGMATIYAEAVLAQKTRVISKSGEVSGGPVYYIPLAFKGAFGKFLAGFFAFSAMLSLGFMGCMVQSNSIVHTFNSAFNTPPYITGIAISVLSAFIFLGGIGRIGAVTEKLVPLMAGLYIFGCLLVLAINYKYLYKTFNMIFVYAFTPKAVLGGSVGSAIYTAVTQGAKRGLFSNEAGMGSTPHAHAQANVKCPHEQGVVAMISVFIDTFIILTLTSLVVISTLFAGKNAPLNPETFSAGIFLKDIVIALGFNGATLSGYAFGSILKNGAVGDIFIAVCLFFFAFSTIISWNLFGKINASYLFGKRFSFCYSALSILFLFLGSLVENHLAFELCDMFNNLMVIPNVISLFALSGFVIKSKKRNVNFA